MFNQEMRTLDHVLRKNVEKLDESYLGEKDHQSNDEEYKIYLLVTVLSPFLEPRLLDLITCIILLSLENTTVCQHKHSYPHMEEYCIAE